MRQDVTSNMMKEGEKPGRMRPRIYGAGMLKGMAVTMKHFLGRSITTSYPEEKLTVSRRFRGNELVWYPQKCTRPD